jgi:ferredoxin
MPEAEWPWYFIDPDTCIDCGACVPECPFEAIFPEEEVPGAYELADDQEVKPMVGEKYKSPGTIIDLTPDIAPNYDFFQKGPGYAARG